MVDQTVSIMVAPKASREVVSKVDQMAEVKDAMTAEKMAGQTVN